MDKRNVVVVLRESPLNSIRNTEGLRHCVGLTLDDNHVTALLVDAAVWLAHPMSPALVEAGDVKKPLDMLALLKMRVIVEKESLELWGLQQGVVVKGVEIMTRDAVSELLAAADIAYAF